MSAPAALVDEVFAPLLLALRDCLDAELSRSLAGSVCRAYVEWRPVAPVMDGCDCECVDEASGQAGNGDCWVRLIRIERDQPSGGMPAGCAPPRAAIIGLGSYRCIPIPEQGEPLPAEIVTATSLMLHADAAAYMRVIEPGCCELFTSPTSDELGLGRPEFLQLDAIRAANCGGGEMQFRLPVRKKVTCPPWPSQ